MGNKTAYERISVECAKFWYVQYTIPEIRTKLETGLPISCVVYQKNKAIVLVNKRTDKPRRNSGLRLIECPISQYRLGNKGGLASILLTTAVLR